MKKLLAFPVIGLISLLSFSITVEAVDTKNINTLSISCVGRINSTNVIVNEVIVQHRKNIPALKINPFTCPDEDADGVSNYYDNCPDIYNPEQIDIDANGTGDACQLWEKTYGDSGDDYFSNVHKTNDDGYISVGNSDSFGNRSKDGWVIKTNNVGTTEWSIVSNKEVNDTFESVIELGDYFYVVGGADTYLTGDKQATLTKLDQQGNILWSKEFGERDFDDLMESVDITDDGSLIITGFTHSYGAGGYDGWLVKTNSDGNVQWSHTFGSTGHDYFQSAHQTSDGGFIVVGTTLSYAVGNSDVWIVKLDANGKEEWDTVLGGVAAEFSYSIQQTPDNGYVLGAYTYSFSTDYTDDWVVKLDAAGNIIWEKIIDILDYDFLYSTYIDSEGAIYVAGNSGYAGTSDFDGTILKLSQDGELLATQLFNSGQAAAFMSIANVENNYVVIGGFTENENKDGWLKRITF